MKRLPPITPLIPSLLPKLWGGNRLAQIKHSSLSSIGESWEVSTHPQGESIYQNLPLSQWIGNLPYLIKLIDTSDNLSIQVHPDDSYAKLHENCSGKTECWIILEATPGAGIYLGFQDGITKEILGQELQKSGPIDQLLKFHPVKPGDFYFVPAGSIHAIGKNVMLVEIQQSSGITYRVWDWNRLTINGIPRQLHIQKALDVLRFEPECNSLSYFRHQSSVMKSNQLLVDHPQFAVNTYRLPAKQKMKLSIAPARINSLLLLTGQAKIVCQQAESVLNAYQSILISSNIEIEALNDSEFIWVF